MPFTLPSRIYPITDVSVSNLSHLEQFERLVEGGASVIQLREKTASPRGFYEAAREVLSLAEKRGVEIIINDRADIAFALKTGAHLGQDDLPPLAARKLLGKNAIIGFSTHNVEQAIAAAGLPVDYIAIGPVFATKTKQNPEPAVGLEGVERVRKAVGNFPLVAIGGIRLENAGDVFSAGADSIAVINALLAEPDKIAEKMRRFLDL
ncbi:MAG TPA: thiamine phosphate synthase [Pyrinomonadaceae bacterium]|nr:thiamine phosphate synthase [Pyrinomonadaceae bacterium]